jgi:hypothetical protein
MRRLSKSILSIISIALLFSFSYSEDLFDTTTKNSNKTLVMARGRVGEIKLGMNSHDIYAVFGKDITHLVDLQLEGMYSPAIEVFKSETTKEKPEIIVELNQETVCRIQVHSPRYRTEKGIGVGSTFGDLRRIYGIKHPKQIIWGAEGFYGVVIRGLGMSFRLDIESTMNTAQINGYYNNPDPRRIPDNTKIKMVLVH